MDRPAAGMHARIELNLAKGSLVIDQILLQDGIQRLGLLRAEVDALEVANLDFRFVLLLQRAKHQKEIPDVDPYLHAVGVVLAVIGGVSQLNRRLRRICHRNLAAGSAGKRSVTKNRKGWTTDNTPLA